MIILLISGHWLHEKIGDQERVHMATDDIIKTWPHLEDYVDSIVGADFGTSYDDVIELVRDDTLPVGVCYCHQTFNSGRPSRWIQ